MDPAIRNLLKRLRRHFWSVAAALLILADSAAHGLRCYTDTGATKTESVECGLNTGCVKVYINSEELLMKQTRTYGYPPAAGKMPELPPEYQNDPVQMRGCFVLAVPDRCYNADNGLSYCWCSTKDLCNAAPKARVASGAIFAALAVLCWTLRTFL